MTFIFASVNELLRICGGVDRKDSKTGPHLMMAWVR